MRSAEGRRRRAWPEQFGRVQQGERLLLGLRNLYIVPTGFGGLWLAGAALLLVVGIQTQRNGPLLLGYLLLALLLLALHLSHDNLQGLELSCGTPRAGFADEPLLYPLRLRSSCRREAVVLRLTRGEGLPPQRLEAGLSQLTLPWHGERRGRHSPGTLLIRSSAPLGLFVCWSRWQPPAAQLIYPARRHGPVGLVHTAAARQTLDPPTPGSTEGSEHWHDLRPHRPQDSPSRLAWKALAQGRGQLTKVFADGAAATPRLTPAGGVSHERALEHLSEAIWQHSRRGTAFGLDLPGHRIPPGRGREHRDRCLEALALCR
jgi:uncharacterized protein (DUF58 family)